jgi:hypothetical protein
MRTFDSNELHRRVDEVLFYVWDPIGVSPEPCARAEYENYVLEVLAKLEETSNAVSISKHLAAIVRNNMGLPPDTHRCDAVAELLLEHKRAVEQGLA